MIRRPLLVALLLCLPLPARADEAEPQAPPLHVVRSGPLTTGCQRDGVVRSDGAQRVVLQVEGEAGRLEVASVGTALAAGGRVARGDVLLVVRAPDRARVLRAAREALEAARRQAALLQAEHALALEGAKSAIEQAEAAARDAARALERFTTLEAAAALEDKALDEEQYANGVADQRDELGQLEKLYKGTQLAPDTKEIVLERARRDGRVAERRLALTKVYRQLHDQWQHPDRQRALEESARWTAGAAQRTRQGEQLAALARAQALEAAGQAVRDAEERLERLQGDEGRLTVTAPADGVVVASELRPGDALGAGQQVTTLLDPARLVVEVAATEDDLRYLQPGRAVRVLLPAYPEVTLDGQVRDVAALGAPGADGRPAFRCVVALAAGDGLPELLRLGVRARIEAEGEVVRRALTVPRRAVTERDGRTFVRVWVGDRAQELEVVLGAGSRDLVQVVSGLVAGDRVVSGEAP